MTDGGAVATEAHTPDMNDTTQQPAPDDATTSTVIESDTERELRAELAAAERRLLEQGEQVARLEAVERASTGTELVAVGEIPNDSRWHVMRQIANELASATVIPNGLRRNNHDETAANVLTVILKGYEIGLGPTTSLDLINIIEGKPSISGPGMAALITGRGHFLEFVELRDEGGKISGVECTGRRCDTHATITLSFTRDDAVAAGLCKLNLELPYGVEARGKEGKKKPWELYTPDMYRWRSLSRVARILFGDVLGGIGYIPDELQPDTIDVEGEDVTAPQMQGEPMSAEQRGEMNRRVQAMSTEQRAQFFAELKRLFETGELPPKHLLGADHYLTVVSVLDTIAAPSSTPEESSDGARESEPDATTSEASTTSDAVIVVTERGEHDDPSPRFCIEIESEADGLMTTFTDADLENGQRIEIAGAQFTVVATWHFDQRPM